MTLLTTLTITYPFNLGVRQPSGLLLIIKGGLEGREEHEVMKHGGVIIGRGGPHHHTIFDRQTVLGDQLIHCG